MRAPSAILWGAAASACLHVGAALFIRRLPKRPIARSTLIAVVESRPKPKPKRDHEPEPKKEPEPPSPPKVVAPRPAPKVVAAPPPPPPVETPRAAPPTNAFAGNPSLAALPNVGALSGGGGLAIPTGGGGGEPGGGSSGKQAGSSPPTKEKILGGAPAAKVAGGAESGDGDCAEEPSKPKPTAMPQPTYSDEARASEIEGAVTIRVRVGPDGRVVEATLVKGLGHGLDERALAAARSWTFSPGLRCGKPAESRFVMSMRFTLGE